MQKRGKILVADDDQDIREVLRLLLTAEGYEVHEAENGIQAVEQANDSFDLIILDVIMPEMNGLTACERIRESCVSPVLFLTAKSQDSDKVVGFAAGGDDYLIKPFSYSELISRVKAMIRRYRGYTAVSKSISQRHTITIKDIVIDTDSCEVKRNGKVIILTDIEYRILVLLAENPHKVFSTQNIYETVWNEPYFYSSNNTIMVHIRNLRKKLCVNEEDTELIRTVWGKGYRIGT